MSVSCEVRLNQKTLKGLKKVPDDVLYIVAKQTLDLSVPIIPKDTKIMSRQTVSNGVKGGNGDFYLTSSPSYASYVWKMPESTNWTTPGTNNMWFARALKRHGKTIIDNAINQSWKKDMQ